MQRLIPLLLLMALPAALVCADPEASAVTTSTPVWLQALIGILSLVITGFLLPYLKQKAAESAAVASATKIDATKSLIEQRGILADRLKSYLWGTAEALVEDRFPRLAADIVSGKLSTKEQVKAQLYAWGDELKARAIEYFKNQGIDLISEFGEKAIDDLIERAANAVSPFPGKETAVAVLEHGVAPQLIQHGVEWMKTQVLTATPKVSDTAQQPLNG